MNNKQKDADKLQRVGLKKVRSNFVDFISILIYKNKCKIEMNFISI